MPRLNCSHSPKYVQQVVRQCTHQLRYFFAVHLLLLTLPLHLKVHQYRVKSGNFGQRGKFGHTFANSENPDETALKEPSHQDFHCLLS